MTDRKIKITANALKDRFKAGSIPLQNDFADLIDIANIGRLAVGDNGTGKALSLDRESRLELDTSQIIVKHLDLTYGTGWVDYDTNFNNISDLRTQLVFLATDTAVGPVEAAGSSTDNYTIFSLPAIKVLNGNTEEIKVKIRGMKKSGISYSVIRAMHVSRGGNNAAQAQLSFVLDEPEKYANCQLAIDPLLLEMRFLTDMSGVGEYKRIYQFNFTFNGSAQVIPKGLISMFSGSTAPRGWALCDGENGTPDLRDRFVVCRGNTYTGRGNGTTSTSSTVVTGQVNVEDTKLTINQIPHHTHSLIQNNLIYSNGPLFARVVTQTMAPNFFNPETGATGGGGGHTHNAILSTDAHSHSFSAIPPYYALAFIMKL